MVEQQLQQQPAVIPAYVPYQRAPQGPQNNQVFQQAPGQLQPAPPPLPPPSYSPPPLLLQQQQQQGQHQQLQLQQQPLAQPQQSFYAQSPVGVGHTGQARQYGGYAEAGPSQMQHQYSSEVHMGAGSSAQQQQQQEYTLGTQQCFVSCVNTIMRLCFNLPGQTHVSFALTHTYAQSKFILQVLTGFNCFQRGIDWIRNIRLLESSSQGFDRPESEDGKERLHLSLSQVKNRNSGVQARL